MDKEGLDVAILYPSRGLFVLAVDGLDPELATAIAKAYNDWMSDFCQVAPKPNVWRRHRRAPRCLFGGRGKSPHSERAGI